jgi:Reverse transcriptase (RNA-dependent DNA polymerase).
LFSLSVLLQKCRDQGKDVFICFIDYAKAFDCVKHSELMAILDAKGLDNNDLQILFYLYRHQVASVRLENGLTTETPINRGVRQGCVLSPLLFNDYSESIFQKSLEHANEGIKINGKPLSNIRYADDTAVLADSAEDLQLLLNRLMREENDLGMKINTTKTKVMVISRNPNLQANITIYGKPIEQVARFKYLGCWLTDNLDPDLEIRTRIEMARATFLKMKTLLADRSLRITTRLRFVKCYVYSVLLYGVEAWTMKVSTMNRLEAFEMWIYRRMLRISWVDHVTNFKMLIIT